MSGTFDGAPRSVVFPPTEMSMFGKSISAAMSDVATVRKMKSMIIVWER